MKTKLLTLDIPEDLDRLPEWLEGHLLGLDLHQVATELRVLNGVAEEPTVSLADVLGDKFPEVLQTGLRSLSKAELRQLLRQPQLLIELQKRVLGEGGEYWTTVPQSDEVAENTKKTWAKLQAAIAHDVPKSELVPPTPSSRNVWLLAGAGWLAAIAASVALFFVRADRVHHLEERIAHQAAEIDSLRNNLLAQPRVVPADLPDADEKFVHVTTDQDDLPVDDPQDLPEIQ